VVAVAVEDAVSLPPLRVTVVQMPVQLPQLPPVSGADSRWRMLVVLSTPDPPVSVAEPVLTVTGTERLV
jgi:hypothetical protein